MPSSNTTRGVEPPELPKLRRRLSFGLMQSVGLAVLLLIPILALFRLFGQGEAFVTGQSGQLKITAEYSERLRHGSADVLVAQVTNSGANAMDTVTVIFDSTYMSRLSEPRFTPPVARAFELDLIDIGPGETRRIELDFYAEENWSHEGDILAVHAGDTARVTVKTFVFP